MEQTNIILQNNNFIFVDQNDAAATRSQRARLRRSQNRTTFTLDTSLLESSQFEAAAPSAPIVHTLDDRVIKRFFARWSEGQTTLACLAPLPTLLEAAGPHSAMQTAILAVAYADIAVFERAGDLSARSYQAYCGTLQRLQAEVSDPAFVASDSYLATVLTVDAFELLYMSRTEPLGIHTRAIARLLELRQDPAGGYESNNHLWRSAYQRIHVRPLFCNVAPITFSASTGRDDTSTGFRTLELIRTACQAIHAFKEERNKYPEHMDYEQSARLRMTMRNLLREAQRWSEHIAAVSHSTRVPINVHLIMELNQVFSMATITTYNNIRMARDQLVLGICIVKILDVLIEQQTLDFSNRVTYSSNEADDARDLLLTAQPDLVALEETCRFILGMIPFLIGLVDRSGTIAASAWSLVDTGVITVKSPLKTIESLVYVSLDIKQEAKSIHDFIDRYRYVVRPP